MITPLFEVVADINDIYSILSKAESLEGGKAFTKKRKDILHQVANDGKVFEWNTAGRALILLPPQFGHDILDHTDLTIKEAASTKFSRSPFPELNDVKTGEIALEITNHGKPMAIFVRKNILLGLANEKNELNPDLKQVMEYAHANKLSFEVEFGANGIQKIRVEGGGDPIVPLASP